MWISKRSETHIKTNIQERWATFNQMRMVQNKAIYTDAIYIECVKEDMDKSKHSTHRKYNNSAYKTIKIKFNGETKTLKGRGEKVTDDYQDEKGEEVKQHVREQPEKLGMTLRSKNRPNYKTISNPNIIC